jgi:CheY-specific phosphatase CheX
MFNKYFGNYILSRKIFNIEQIKSVLAKQQAARPKLGVLAIESGYLTAFQVDRVHRLQVLHDKRFGELAIAEGYLDERQLEELLNKQKTSQVLLGQILVDEGLLTYDGYESLLKDYKKDSGFSDLEIDILKRSHADEVVNLFVKEDGTGPVVELFKEYVELFIRNLVRFIDSDVILDWAYSVANYESEGMAVQEIVGDHRIETGLAGQDEVLVRFASIYAGETLSSLDDLAKDALGEFMNSQNGLFVSNLYHKNINCNLNPQHFMNRTNIRQRGRLYVLPCQLSFGKITIIFNR